MSEFSESLQLRSPRTEAAVELLLRAKAAGYVYPAKSGWVSFAFDPESLSRIVAACDQELLLHYSYAPDHLLRVDGYRPGAGRQVLLSVDLEGGKTRFARAATSALEIVDAAALERIARWAKAPDTSRGGARYAVAEAFGFARYRGFSFESEARVEVLEPGRVVVHGDGIRLASVDDEVEDLLRTLPPTRKGKAPSERRDDAEAEDLLQALADVTALLDERGAKDPPR